MKAGRLRMDRQTTEWLLLLLGFVIYVMAMFLFRRNVGSWTILVVLLPVISVSLKFGQIPGILAGLLSQPVNMLHYHLWGDANYQLLPDRLIIWVSMIIVGWLLGYLRDVTARYRNLLTVYKVTNEALEQSACRVKQLSGILPICSGCKKIRDSNGRWHRIETYIKKHSEAEFSHGLCGDCLKELYPDI